MFPVKLLCEMMGIQRSSFYNWKAHLSKPSEREKALVAAIMLFKEYHLKYPSHGYRWLNAKIFLDAGKKMSDQNCRWFKDTQAKGEANGISDERCVRRDAEGLPGCDEH